MAVIERPDVRVNVADYARATAEVYGLETKESFDSTLPEIGTYKEFSIETAMSSLNEVAMLVGVDEQDELYQQTQEFITTAFDLYQGKKTFEQVFGRKLDKVRHVFTVSARGKKAEEAQQVLKILAHENFNPEDDVQHEDAFKRFLGNLPPFVLANYQVDGEIVGLCMYSPQDIIGMEETFENAREYGALDIQDGINSVKKSFSKGKIGRAMNESMQTAGTVAKNIRENGRLAVTPILDQKRIQRDGQASVNETLLLSQWLTSSKEHPNGSVEYVGLGALIPNIVNYGKAIDKARLGNIETTTGHLLTTKAIMKTLEVAWDEDGVSPRDGIMLGIIGAGNIGTAVADVYLSENPGGKVLISDISLGKAEYLAKQLDKYEKVHLIRDTSDYAKVNSDAITNVYDQRNFDYNMLTRNGDREYVLLFENYDETEREVIENILENYPHVTVLMSGMEVNPKRTDIKSYFHELRGKYGRVNITTNSDDVFYKTQYIVGAATSHVNIPKDLEGAIFCVEDSEPSAMEQVEVEAAGGVFAKPVYQNLDTTDISTVRFQRYGVDYNNKTVNGRYDYGYMDGSNQVGPGLIGTDTHFGCEREVEMATMWARFAKANPERVAGITENPFVIRDRKVTAGDVRRLNNIPEEFMLMLENGIHPEMLQGGGIRIVDKLRNTSEKRRKFLNKAA